MKLRILVLAAGLLAINFAAQADYLGTLSGRSANPANNPQLSVEGSLALGGDYRNIGGRVNYGVNESLTVYGDFGLTEAVGDGTSFGAGVFYYLPNLSEATTVLNSMDVAVQGSFHTSSLDFIGVDLDRNALGVAVLVSPKEAFNTENGMNWYANAGFTRITYDFQVFGFGRTSSTSDFNIQLGGGIYLPMGPGTLYAGADLIDGVIFGVGYRYGIN